MKKYMRTGLTVIAVLFGAAWVVAEQGQPQQGPGGAQPGPRGQGAGQATTPAPDPTRNPRTKKVVLAWADTRNGQAQKDYFTHIFAQLERYGYDSGVYDLHIRTDSNVISFNPKKTDGTPASGGPSLKNVDAILYAGHRDGPLDEAGQKDLVTAIRDQGKGFVSLYIGILPWTTFPEMANILGAKAAAVDVHDPFPSGSGSTIINESPESPITRHLPAIWTLPYDAPYPAEHFNRGDIQVLLRRDVSKLAPAMNYTRADGDYPVAWAKMYGKGRVFYSSLGHAPEKGAQAWDDNNLLRMYYEAIKWSLGLTAYELKPHQLPADVRRPSGSCAGNC